MRCTTVASSLVAEWLYIGLSVAVRVRTRAEEWEFFLVLFFFPGSQISPPLHSLVPPGGQLARNACTVLEYDCPLVTFGAMSGTLRYNCSSQQWSAIDLTSCSGALHANSTACNEL